VDGEDGGEARAPVFATIRRYEPVGGSPDDRARAGRALAARLSQAPGFVSCAALEACPGVLAWIGYFETAADLAAAERLVAGWAAEHRATLLPEPPQVTAGEVVAQKGL
jgi:hypothetical protein